MMRETRRTARVAAAAIITAAILATGFAAPAFAQGVATVEPTLAECRAFAEENGLPQTRPVWENRGYSGWDVCLNMAYDGDMEGYFASADANGDGRLGAAEQRAYMDTVIGPVSDPDQSPLTLDKCRNLVSDHGIPAERPFVDWSNRGYGEAEICQSLAFDGNLDASFSSADVNADGRLDHSEQSSYVASFSRASEGVASETEGDEPISRSQDESAAHGQYETNAAEEQYGNAGQEETTASPTEPTMSSVPAVQTEPTVPAQPAEPSETDETAESAQTAEPEKGVLSAVNEAVRELLPETGGVPMLGVLGGAILIVGGFFAYRFLR